MSWLNEGWEGDDIVLIRWHRRIVQTGFVQIFGSKIQDFFENNFFQINKYQKCTRWLSLTVLKPKNHRALLEHSPTKGNHVLPFVRHCQNLVISDNCNTINFAPCCSTLAGFTKHYIFSKFMTCVITVCQCCKTDDWKTENNLPHSKESNTPATNTNKKKNNVSFIIAEPPLL